MDEKEKARDCKQRRRQEMYEKEKARYCKKGRRQERWMRKRKQDIVRKEEAGNG